MCTGAAVVIGVAAALLAACATTPTPAPVPSALERLAQQLSGSFSSSAQAAADGRFLAIELRVQRIWPERGDGPWLYVEQATASARARPYRQRVYRLSQAPQGPQGSPEAGELVSSIYTLPGDPLRYAGADAAHPLWRQTEPAQLALRGGCEVHMRAQGTGFAGATRGTGCASDLRGASHATSEVELRPGGMTSWDRGFDAQGRQVWGSEAGGYRFDRTDRTDGAGPSGAALNAARQARPASSSALPPAAAVFTVTVCSAQKRAR